MKSVLYSDAFEYTFNNTFILIGIPLDITKKKRKDKMETEQKRIVRDLHK